MLVCCPINNYTKSFDPVEDRSGVGGPDKGLGMGVLVRDVVIDVLDELYGGDRDADLYHAGYLDRARH